MRVAVYHARARVPVRFPEINVIPQPEHGVRVAVVNGRHDLVFAAVGRSRAIVFRFIHIETTADSQGKIGRIGAKLPQGLGLKPGRIRQFHRLVIDEQLVIVLLTRFNLVGDLPGRIPLFFCGCFAVGQGFSAGRTRFPISELHHGRRFGLHPEQDFFHFAVPQHRARLEQLFLAKCKGGQAQLEINESDLLFHTRALD